MRLDNQTRMDELGVSKTVYSLVYPESQAVLQEVLQDPDLPGVYEDAHTKKQNDMHGDFFDAYLEWSRGIADIDSGKFRYMYPANGSTEAIRESIAFHASVQRALGVEPRIHVFEGEYEGYRAYAEAYDVEVVVHPRSDFQNSLHDNIRSGDRFYLSQPSGIDGNVWTDYENFMKFLEEQAPDLPVMLDLAYVGTVADPDYLISTTHANIEAIFFSLSKSFGVYYHRIGGVFSKTEIPGLYGNMWFKNLLSLRYGQKLMEQFGPHDLPQKYKGEQLAAIEKLKAELGSDIEASDVVLLATQKTQESEEDPLKIALTRADKVRFCLTPAMDKQIKS